MIRVLAVWFAVAVAMQNVAQASVTWLYDSGPQGEYTVQVRDLTLREVPALHDDVNVKLVGAEGYDGILKEEGKPNVPVIRFYVDGDAQITVASSNEKSVRRQRLSRSLAPVQESAAKLPGAVQTYVRDAAVYARAALYPSASFEIADAGKIRGRRRQLVTLYPAAYYPTTQAVTLKREFTVRVKPVLEAPVVEGEKAYVFVVGPSFRQSASLARFARQKESEGYTVITVDMDSLPKRTAAQARARLLELYQQYDLRYVLLVGDAEEVPAHSASGLKGVTDHPYRVLDTEDYLADVNGPDVGVGRFPAVNETQLSAMVDKSIRYMRELRTPQAGLERVSWLATNDDSNWEFVEDTHNYAIGQYFAQSAYRGVFPRSPMPGGDHLYAVTHRAERTDVLAALQEGRALIHYSGHGLEKEWDNPHVSQSDVRSLRSSALPIVYSSACLTGDFREPEAFSETWMRHPQGAVFFTGSMDLSYWDEDDVMERRQYDGIFQLGKRTMAEINQFALGEVWRHYGGAGRSKYYWETYVNFGDPALEFRPL